MTSFSERLLQLLPKLKTPLQLAAFLILALGVLATHATPTTGTKTSIAIGFVSVAFMVFSFVFERISQFPPKSRSKLVIVIFIFFCITVLTLFCTAALFLNKAIMGIVSDGENDKHAHHHTHAFGIKPPKVESARHPPHVTIVPTNTKFDTLATADGSNAKLGEPITLTININANLEGVHPLKGTPSFNRDANCGLLELEEPMNFPADGLLQIEIIGNAKQVTAQFLQNYKYIEGIDPAPFNITEKVANIPLKKSANKITQIAVFGADNEAGTAMISSITLITNE